MKSLIFIQILIFLILNCIEVAVPAQENDWRNSKLIIYLPFENNLKDVSNHLNDGRASLQSYSTDRFGKQNGAYSFENGLHSRIYIPNYPNPYEYDFSICIWAFTKSRSRQSLVSKRYDHDEVIVWPFVIELMSNGKISFYLRKDIHDEHIIFINSEVRYPLNEWMFIAAVR